MACCSLHSLPLTCSDSRCLFPERIVTIGPAVLLCLLGITFYIGSKPQKGVETETAAEKDPASPPTNIARSNSTVNSATTGGLCTANVGGAPSSDPVKPPPLAVRRAPHPTALKRRESSLGRIRREGAGDETDAEQVGPPRRVPSLEV